MKSVLIGNRTLVYSGTLILRDGESARLEIPFQEGQFIGQETLKVELIFTNPAHADTSVNWQTLPDGSVRFTFIGWKSPVGTALKEPQSFGKFNNEDLWMDLAHYMIGQANVAHVLFSRGVQ
jgi:hypothetical protein